MYVRIVNKKKYKNMNELIEYFRSIPTKKQKADERFEKHKPKTDRTILTYVQILNFIAKRIGINDIFTHLAFPVDLSNEVKTYLDTLSLSDRQKKSMVLSQYIPFLKLDKEIEKFHVREYLNICKEAKTPNPRTVPFRGPTDKIRYRMRPEPIVLPTIDNIQRVKRTQWPIDPNCMEQINILTRSMKDHFGNKLQSANSYKGLILRLMKVFKQTDLNFLVTNYEDVLEFFHSFPLPKIGTPRAYYSPISRYIYIAKPVEAQDVAYRKYLNWIQTAPLAPTARFRAEQYKGYNTWTKLKNKVDQILQKKTIDPLHKLLLSLYVDIPPRRSRDYTYMLINVKDDQEHNILQLNNTGGKPRFIFNSYKTVVKSMPQKITIDNPHLINVLTEYINTYVKGKRTYLLENNEGRALHKDDIQKILRDDIGKLYKIPSGIRTLRHLYVTHIVMDKNIDPRNFVHTAFAMGTSVNMMIQRYTTFDLENLHKLSDAEQTELLRNLQKDFRYEVIKEDDEEFKNDPDE